MLLFLNYRNMNANTIAESKSLSERFRQRHRALEDYITEVGNTLFLKKYQVTYNVNRNR